MDGGPWALSDAAQRLMMRTWMLYTDDQPEELSGLVLNHRVLKWNQSIACDGTTR